MSLGRQCVGHYRTLHRYNVFSHDEMVCNMAAKAETLDVVLASAVHKDMAVMIAEERELRAKVAKMVKQSRTTRSESVAHRPSPAVWPWPLKGLVQWREAEYDHLQDDERQCAKCRTTCYLSAVTCPCSPGVLVCLHHVGDLCACPLASYTLK